MLPMAIWRIPRSFFFKAQRKAPRMKRQISLVIFPDNRKLQSKVIDDNALCPASPAETDIISFKNCGLKPSMPAADPQGNELMAFLTSVSLTLKIWQSVRFRFGNINFRDGCGCLDLRIFKVSSSNVAKVSLELSTRTKLLFTIFEVYVFFHYEF
jgi:hypothetical protein